MLNHIRGCFDAADADGSQALDAVELAAVLKELYRYEKTSRSSKQVAREVTAAMKQWDRDGDGCLDFWEVLTPNPRHNPNPGLLGVSGDVNEFPRV